MKTLSNSVNALFFVIWIQGLFIFSISKAQQPVIEILSPHQGESVRVGSNKTVTVVFASTVSTDVWVYINSHISTTSWPIDFGLLSTGEGEHVEVGISKKTYAIPGTLFGGDSFSISITPPDSDGYFFPIAESSRFFIQDNIPTITLSPLSGGDQVWRSDESKLLQCVYQNMYVGDSYIVFMRFSDPVGLWPGETYGFILATGIFNTGSDSISIPITVPKEAIVGEHILGIHCSSKTRNYYAPVYVGSPDVPTAAKVIKLQVELPVSDPLSYSEGRVILTCEGFPYQNYHVQESTDLVNWQSVTDMPIFSPSGSFYFMRIINDEMDRFYRMIEAEIR